MYLKKILVFIFISTLSGISIKTSAQSDFPDYSVLKNEFTFPDYASWGEVPLWWWEGDSLSKERVTWELEKLAEKGVKSICPIQRSPARCFPESFTDDWWKMVSYVHEECERLDMHLWLYDQIGYGHYGWLEKAAAQVDNTGTSNIKFYSATGNSSKEIRIDLSQGNILIARAYPIIDGIASDGNSIDISEYVKDDLLIWNPPLQGEWKVAVSVEKPYRSFYMNEASTDVFLKQLYQKIENVVGQEAMGNSLAGVFQDEHPPTPRDIYTQELADTFKTMFGYDIGRAIPALHFDVGAKTPKYRINYFDAYLAIVEKTYWEKVYNWIANKKLLTSHDNWGRNNIYGHSEGYIDYFRTQRWFSAPGFDDYRQRSIVDRNYYDTKIASSIARLYNRPRVWAEAFHSSGWGRTTNQTLSWLSALYAFGTNLYDEHGLYYSLNASTWEHAAGDPHWNQPYWEYYQKVSDWVSRTSYLMSQGEAVADVAVHYPVVSVLADIEKSDIDYNTYMELSRIVYNEGIDNDIIDDQSILDATVREGRIEVRGNKYQALIFGPEATIRLKILEKALELVKSGGVVLFYGKLPFASVENGREDIYVLSILEQLLGASLKDLDKSKLLQQNFDNGGFAAYLPEFPELLPALLSVHINRDFVGSGGNVFISHRRIGDINVYLIQNIEDEPIQLKARFRADGVPEIWNAFSGKIREVNNFERKNGYTYTNILLEGNVAQLLILNPRKQTLKQEKTIPTQVRRRRNYEYEKKISENWDFSVIPTCDNKWGDFKWPSSNEKIGPEIRQFKYKEEKEKEKDGIASGWNLPGFDDYSWEKVIFDQGPYWLAIQEIPEDANVVQDIISKQERIKSGVQVSLDGNNYEWEELTFSKKTGLNKPAPWGGHSGYPDGHYDKNFIQLKEGRKILFTRIYSPQKQRVGLTIQLRNKEPRLWVNGKQEQFSGAVGDLPLNKGYNFILLDLPDGSGGMLYVQKESPAIKKLGKNSNKPDLSDASWIWIGDSEGAYFRKSIEIIKLPKTAYVTVTGFTGFRLFINGKKIEDDIGPWATWNYPKSINIKPYLKEGKNLFAAWGQFLKGMNVSFSSEYQGFILAMKAVYDDGSTFKLETGPSWKGHTEELENWQSLNFNDDNWDQVTVKGKAGDKPWGEKFLQNVGTSTTPSRPLSVNLNTPLLEVFNEMPDIVYDVKPESDDNIGWYRFEAPPGLKEMTLNANAKDAAVWINGIKVPVKDGVVKINTPPVDKSCVAIRLEMKRDKYAGAAFSLPVKLKLEGGKIQPGSWENYALPTYSGIVVYKQKINFNINEVKRQVFLDLGEVYVGAEVFVNGESAGIKVAEPFKFNISQLIQPGINEIEVRVANTLAPHYSVPIRTLILGPVKSGLIGPVSLKISSK